MHLLSQLDFNKILFLDIETVPAQPSFSSLSPQWQQLWEKKSKSILKENISAADVYDRSAIYAEFGKVVCICAGIITGYPHNPILRLKSFYNDDESILLREFAELLEVYFSTDRSRLCAHNGKEFDFPYLSRRMLVHGIKLPLMLDNAGKKPWEIAHLDTMELWKMGDFKSYTSLELLANLFGIPTPKDDIDGSMVAQVYYRENNLKRIVDYCLKDVVTLCQLFLKMNNQATISESSIIYPTH
jgi:predicted PolB exonuclease-like 3'-5' exonuclease